MPTSKNSVIHIEEITTFMGEYGRAYLSCGGPTSRVEEALSSLGRQLGYPTEVFATPTGIFINCLDHTRTTHTNLSRVKGTGMNLGKLCWLEGIFEDVYNKKISISQANKILHSKILIKPIYTQIQTILAAFILGAVLSFMTYQGGIAAIISGFITIATWWVTGPALASRVTSSVFKDFIGCIVTLGLAAAFQLIYSAPFEAYSIGGLVILVPGLSLTTAISEVADQNLVSGTAKIMQSMLTLLALGLAYLLFQDLATAAHITAAVGAGARPLSLLPSAFCVFFSSACFGILFNIPRKSLPWASLTGLLGWFVLMQFSATPFIVAASFLSSLLVGMVSLFLGSRFNVPSQVFSVPGILIMLPGMLALTSFKSFAMGQGDQGVELAFRVATTAGSIVFGLFSARIPFALKKKKPRTLTSAATLPATE